MTEAPKFNLNNPAIKRIMKEIKEMERENSTLYYARPMEVHEDMSLA
jgi:ubiquitin-protein ligase